ncbi:unnamed protein product [Caenorhabditis angaria]|uniref:C3H1-type domain-containing protein n=1 Tax=Caenorhabditis angaria TaxID=860376 RepID=A0A9P1IAG5_9PELO|nr:unnamed protein product [Caenorhabditis angaria]
MAANRTIADMAFVKEEDKSYFEESSLFPNMNQTLPNFDFDRLEKDFSKLLMGDQNVRLAMQGFSRNALLEQDPRTLADDTRENLMREKRRIDSFKTALCEQHRRTGKCPYGDNCRFAHAVEELRLQNAFRGRNHPKYKTVLCDKFTINGVCRYGNRCQFIHRLANDEVVNQLRGVTDVELPPPKPRVPLVDMNQSLPVNQNDIARAFGRSVDFGQPSVQRLARFSDREYRKATFMN